MAGPDDAVRAAPDADADAVLADPSVTFACKSVLRLWLERDPVDAAADAQLLAAVLAWRSERLLGRFP